MKSYFNVWKKMPINKFIRILFLTCQISGREVTSTNVEVAEGSAVRFDLPSYRSCGRYNFLNPETLEIISVQNATHCEINDIYNSRALCIVHPDGTVVLGVHKMNKTTDVGHYMIRGPQVRACLRGFNVTVTEPYTSGVWLEWHSWSTCNASCFQSRTRLCSGNSVCIGGLSQEVGTCTSHVNCGDEITWSPWSPWGDCSCEHLKQLRHRYCLDNNGERTQCPQGTAGIETATCICENTRTDSHGVHGNTHWGYWSAWGACSRTCAQGQQSRSRSCLDSNSLLLPGSLCAGNGTEIRTCLTAECSGQNDQVNQGKDITVTISLSTIVGVVAGVLILVLVIVVGILLVKLKYKRRNDNGTKPKKAKDKKKKEHDRPQSVSVSGVHTYAEIGDDEVIDVKPETSTHSRAESIYVPLPQSPSGYYPTQYGNVTYSNASQSVIFDQVPENNEVGYRSELRPPYAYNTTSTGSPESARFESRQVSLDSIGYMVPKKKIFKKIL